MSRSLELSTSDEELILEITMRLPKHKTMIEKHF